MPRRHSHTTASAAAQAMLTESKQVSFAIDTCDDNDSNFGDDVHVIDLIEDRDLERVFYTRQQIKEMQRDEMCAIQQAVRMDLYSIASETEKFTWRGVEDWKKGTPCPNTGRQARVKEHSKTVIQEWKRQDMFGPTAFGDAMDLQERWDALRVVSKASSKDARLQAVRRAVGDAQAAGVRRSASASAASMLKGMNPLKMMRHALPERSLSSDGSRDTNPLKMMRNAIPPRTFSGTGTLRKDSQRIVTSATA